MSTVMVVTRLWTAAGTVVITDPETSGVGELDNKDATTGVEEGADPTTTGVDELAMSEPHVMSAGLLEMYEAQIPTLCQAHVLRHDRTDS